MKARPVPWVLVWVCIILYTPILMLGRVLYYLSKLIRALGQLMMLNKHSAREQLRGFWKVYTALGDIE